MVAFVRLIKYILKIIPCRHCKMRPNYRLKQIQGWKVVTTHEKDKSKTFNVSRDINLTLFLKAASTAKFSFSEKSRSNAMIIGVVLVGVVAVIAAIVLLLVCKNKTGKTLFWLLLLIYGLYFIYWFIDNNVFYTFAYRQEKRKRKHTCWKEEFVWNCLVI